LSRPNLATAVPYRVIALEDKCHCDQACLLSRYGSRYALAVFEVGNEYIVTWWLSKN